MSGNMSSISKVINNVLHGTNEFCALCFKIDDNIVFHDEINIILDETEQTIPLSDILQSVFGKEVQEYLSTFENICEDCIQLLITLYTFTQTCHNNVTTLMKAIDTLDYSLCTKDQNKNTRTLFVAMDMKNCTNKLTYDNEKLDSVTLALKRYKFLNVPKLQESVLKSPNFKKNKILKIKISDMLLDPNDEKPRCKECSKVYLSLYSLRSHYLRVHAPKNYKCVKCSKGFGSPTQLSYHMSVDHCEIICSECGKEFSNKSTFMRHEMSHHLKLVCPECGRIYRSSITYKRHIELNVCKQEVRANPANAQYTCDHCGKKYTQKMSLRVHIQYNHGNYKAHVCKWCGKKFWAQSRLKAHIVKHTKEKKFVCSICQGKFVTKESLLYHTRLHTGEKPYKCSQCDCSFLSASRRAYHMKAYHLRAMVECDACHSKFSSRAYLDKHKKTHKECQNIKNDTKLKSLKDDIENQHCHSKKFRKTKDSVDRNQLLMQLQDPEENYSVEIPEKLKVQATETYILGT